MSFSWGTSWAVTDICFPFWNERNSESAAMCFHFIQVLMTWQHLHCHDSGNKSFWTAASLILNCLKPLFPSTLIHIPRCFHAQTVPANILPAYMPVHPTPPAVWTLLVTQACLWGSWGHLAHSTLSISLFNYLIGLLFLSGVQWQRTAEMCVLVCVRACVFTCHVSVHLWQEGCLLAAGIPALLCTF